jgi:hypothetical protein
MPNGTPQNVNAKSYNKQKKSVQPFELHGFLFISLIDSLLHLLKDYRR